MMRFFARKYDWDEQELRGYTLLLEREETCLAALAQDVPINSAPLFGVQSA